MVYGSKLDILKTSFAFFPQVLCIIWFLSNILWNSNIHRQCKHCSPFTQKMISSDILWILFMIGTQCSIFEGPKFYSVNWWQEGGRGQKLPKWRWLKLWMPRGQGFFYLVFFFVKLPSTCPLFYICLHQYYLLHLLCIRRVEWMICCWEEGKNVIKNF